MRLLRYTLRRLLLLIPVLLAALFVTFFLTRILPGNPLQRVISPYTSEERRAEMMREAYLDRPFYEQFLFYLRDLATGDMGTSYTTSQPVAKDLLERFPATLEVVFYAMVLAIVLGGLIGIVGALAKDTIPDHVGRIFAVLGVSLPVFWLGMMLLFVFFYEWRIAPAPMGRIPVAMSPPERLTGFFTIDALLTGEWEIFVAALRGLMLPVIAIAFTSLAPIARMTRSSMIDALESDYVRTATVLGLPRPLILFQHALKNAIVPVLTITAAVFGFSLGGQVLVEYVFSWPGLGLYAYNAILASDFPAIQGFILLATTVYVLIYLVVDVLSAMIDPRINY
ncbi:MAG: ABC transporter permease [Chloroflexaceae bacterium]|nr:ABC transporter permease [Chloroflexaceae bacterium]